MMMFMDILMVMVMAMFMEILMVMVSMGVVILMVMVPMGVVISWTMVVCIIAPHEGVSSCPTAPIHSKHQNNIPRLACN